MWDYSLASHHGYDSSYCTVTWSSITQQVAYLYIMLGNGWIVLDLMVAFVDGLHGSLEGW
jgi:hypothetical protein